MITGLHAIMFSPEAEQVRAFFGEVLGLSSVDAGGGWLIWVRLVWRDWLTCRVDGWAAAATCCLLLLRQEQGGGLDGVADR